MRPPFYALVLALLMAAASCGQEVSSALPVHEVPQTRREGVYPPVYGPYYFRPTPHIRWHWRPIKALLYDAWEPTLHWRYRLEMEQPAQ